MKKHLGLLLTVLLGFGLAACSGDSAQYNGTISVTVINRTAYDISEIYFSGEYDGEWGSNCLDDILYDGEKAVISPHSSDPDKVGDGYSLQFFDEYEETMGVIDTVALEDGDFITVYYEDNEFYYAINMTYEDVHGINAGSEASFWGLWEYADYDICISIFDDGTWMSNSIENGMIEEGTYTLEGDCLILTSSTGNTSMSLTFNSEGNLVDEDGDVLYPTDRQAGHPAKSEAMDEQTCYYWTDADGGIWYWNGEADEYIGSTDAGDYGDSYYWYDNDGDVWYWNGDEEEYIGSGSEYYLDDGDCYESNDADWK